MCFPCRGRDTNPSLRNTRSRCDTVEISSPSAAATSLDAAMARGLVMNSSRSRAAAVWQEREKLARENQAKSEMLSTLSREIRANLNGIVGSADLMLDHTLSTAQREHLTTMRSSAESLQQSLNDVLDYAGIETGEIKRRVLGGEPYDVIIVPRNVADDFENEHKLVAGSQVPLVVMGDFNDHPHSVTTQLVAATSDAIRSLASPLRNDSRAAVRAD